MVAYCAVYSCRKHVEKTGERVTFFRFPTDRTLREQWLQQLKLKTVNPTLRVCSRHFTSDSFEVSPEIFKSIGWTAKVKLKLKDGAIPTELLASLDQIAQQKRQQQRRLLKHQQNPSRVNHDNHKNADIDVIEKLNTRQSVRSDLEEEDAPCLQRELRLEMLGTINTEHPVVKVEIGEHSPCPQSASWLHPAVKIEDRDEKETILVSEITVDEDFDPGKVKTEVDDENNSSFATELVPERRVKIEIVEEADEFASSFGSCDTVPKMAITRMDAGIQTVRASDEVQDKRIKKITITFVSARKRQKTHSDVATQTSNIERDPPT